MAEQGKELKDAIHTMGQSAPIVAVGKGLAKVGEVMQRGVDAVKRKVSGPPPKDPRIGRRAVPRRPVRRKVTR